jgi:hypothetical protein
MAIIRLFNEALSFDNNLAANLRALLASEALPHTPPQTFNPGDTLVLGRRTCSISALPGDYNYVIVADKLTLTPPPGTSSLVVNGTAGNPSPSVTVLAVEIEGAFKLVSSATPGAQGRDGADGIEGEGRRPNGHWDQPPIPPKKGQKGGAGSPGGKAVIHCCGPIQQLTVSARGGRGGAGGQGGAGIPGFPSATNGGQGAHGARGLEEVSPVDVSEIWNALDSESLVEWAIFRGASITDWNRIEPRSRAQDLRAGLEARLFDPLWLLARQWQIGEFAGRDAGSPVAVNVTTTTRLFDRYSPANGTGQAYDINIPLEVLVEREAIRPVPPAKDLRQAAEAGQHFARLLDAAGLSHLRGAYLAQYPLPGAAGTTGHFGALVAGRVIDGVALHTDLIAVANTLPSIPAISEADRTILLPVVQTWLVWYGSLFSEPSQEHTWSQDRMEYSFSMGAAGETGSFVAREYDGGTADWYTFDKAATTLTGGSAQPSTTTPALASPVSFRGMPARRYWELEDGSVDIGALAAGPEDLGRLLLREFALVYGTDWFLIPLSVPVGSVTNIDSFKVTDTFGLGTTVPHYSVADRAEGKWRMFALSDVESGAAPDYRLLILPSAMGILDSEAVENVLLLRDELADMVWGVERSVLGPDGAPVDRSLAWKTMAPSILPPAAAGVPRYRLGSDVPDYWIPFLPVVVNPGGPVQLRRGRLPTSASGPQGRLLGDSDLPIFLEEVPREGVHLERRYRCTRGADGSTYLWIGRRRSIGRGEGRSGLRFDFLE